jgi:hypothetical protein
VRFQLHHPSMHLVFAFDNGRFGVGFAPFFDITQNRCTLGQPGVLFHVFLFPVSCLMA